MDILYSSTEILIDAVGALNISILKLDKSIHKVTEDLKNSFKDIKDIYDKSGRGNVAATTGANIASNNNNTAGPSDKKSDMNKSPVDMRQALKGAGQKVEDDFGNTFKNIQNLIVNSAVVMRDNMNNFFFDAMTGKLKTAEEYFRSFLTAIQKAIAQFLANEITNKLLKTLFGGMFDGDNNKSDLGSKYKFDPTDFTVDKYIKRERQAKGGRMALNTPFVAGENGPELISIDGAGATVISANTTQSMLSNQSNLAVEVNVINQSGTQMQASQGESRFDGQKYVVDVFLDAWARDVSGLRTAVAGRRQ